MKATIYCCMMIHHKISRQYKFHSNVTIFHCSAGLVKQCLFCTKYNTSCSMPNIFSIIYAQQGADMLHNDIS